MVSGWPIIDIVELMIIRVNVNSRAFSSANEVDRVLPSANGINLNKDDEFGRSFINNRNNNGWT